MVTHVGRNLYIAASILLFLALKVSAQEKAEPQSRTVAHAGGSLFQTSHTCLACHNGLVTPAGEDVSIGFDWRASMMANAARDPYWHASVRREIMDHPESQVAIENECSACHMPMSRYDAKTRGQNGAVFAHLPVGQRITPVDRLAADGVSCSLCHQIEDKNLGDQSSFTGGFLVGTTVLSGQRPIFGPFRVDAGLFSIMQSATSFGPAESKHVQKSELCATCHTLITHSLGPRGEVTGRLPEQIPYAEWFHSSFRDQQSCQSCHMPVVQGAVAISSVLGQPRTEVSRHVFTGGNFFMLRMLNRYRNELGVEALPQELNASASRTIAFLQSQSASISISGIEVSGGKLRADVSIRNLAGHKLPTAYPSRRAWLHVTVLDRNGKTVFESGALGKQGLIEGNDNDLDGSRYEPHYQLIDSEEKVQIYESIMVNTTGGVTTGLLSAVRFIKDNRLLPLGFNPQTAGEDIAVHGDAQRDSDFEGGGDVVRYSINVGEHQDPFRIEAKIWYQPIAHRWAQNLRNYNAPETQRFVSYFDSMADVSAIVLAETKAEVPTFP